LLGWFELLIFTDITPTLFIVFGLRFFFYSNEHLPIHVHVRNADGEARVEVENVRTADGKEKSHPLSWFPKLQGATKTILENFTLSPFGIHWDELDEDLSFDGFFNYSK